MKPRPAPWDELHELHAVLQQAPPGRETLETFQGFPGFPTFCANYEWTFPEKLEKEKADEDLLLGTDVAADTTALAGKVSHTEFDASTKRLNEMVEEMLSQVTDQERVERQFNEEVTSKMDRLELGAFGQQLEGHCKRIVEQLQEKVPQAEADDAAAIKEELAAEGGYPTVQQSCGDQHTDTTPLWRPQRLRLPPRLQPPLLPNTRSATGLLGKDGRIRRVWMDQQLPAGQGPRGTDPARGQPGPDSNSEGDGF
ncbi:uncharacterized protein J5M81_012122 [Pluvialis apricaria]